MTNLWELLLKAKWLSDHSEDVTSLHEYNNDSTDPTQKKAARPWYIVTPLRRFSG